MKSFLQEFVFNVFTRRAEESRITFSGTLRMKPTVHAGLVTVVVSVNAGAMGGEGVTNRFTCFGVLGCSQAEGTIRGDY